MNYTPVNEIEVELVLGNARLPVGNLAYRGDNIFFEYYSSFIDSGLEISPLNCPLSPGLQEFDPRELRPLDGLAGVFYDSLPDGWGRVVLNRKLDLAGIPVKQITALDRLAYVGTTGMGALTYKPAFENDSSPETIDLDKLAKRTLQVVKGEADDVIGRLAALNGSSSGARPKIMAGISLDKKKLIGPLYEHTQGYEPWLIKFPNTNDGDDAGAIEFVYAQMAKKAGLQVEDVHLFCAKQGAGYFSTKRFDRDGEGRLHCHSAAGLLHADFRFPSLDYSALSKLTMLLTKDMREVEKMFRQAVFNVFAHNRDDHAKNFSYLMDATGTWRLSPAYDLTYSSGPSGEHCTMVMGEGMNPTEAGLEKLGLHVGLMKKQIRAAIEQTRDALSQWTELAKNSGVSNKNIEEIKAKIN